MRNPNSDRRSFIGGSDARVIMGNDQDALVRLWREKRGEIEPEDLSDNLIVQLGKVTEDLNRRWYQKHRPGHQGRAAAGTASGHQMDGGHAGRHR
jgi:predicted phage-related endonuclease